jgi:hypothetical protein
VPNGIFFKINLDRGLDGMIKYLYLSEKAFFFCLFFGGYAKRDRLPDREAIGGGVGLFQI